MRPRKLAIWAAYHRARGDIEAAEMFEAELVASGHCRDCGRRLRDPESIERGIGPDCLAARRRAGIEPDEDAP